MTPAMARLLRVVDRLTEHADGGPVTFTHNRPPPAPGYRTTTAGTIRVRGHDRPFRRATLRRLEDAGYVEVERVVVELTEAPGRRVRGELGMVGVDNLDAGRHDTATSGGLIRLTTRGATAIGELPARAGWA